MSNYTEQSHELYDKFYTGKITQWRQLGGSGGLATSRRRWKRTFVTGEKVFQTLTSLQWCEMYIWNKFTPNCVLQTTLYQYLLQVGDGSKVDSNGRRSGWPGLTPPSLMLKYRHCNNILCCCSLICRRPVVLDSARSSSRSYLNTTKMSTKI